MKKTITITFILTLALSFAFTVGATKIQELEISDIRSRCFSLSDNGVEVYNSCNPYEPGLLGSTVTTLSSSDLQSAFPALYNANLNALNNTKLEDSDFTGSTGITYTSTGTIAFDCSEVEGVGINCTTEAITLDATGDWTGTFDGVEGADYLLSNANDTTIGIVTGKGFIATSTTEIPNGASCTADSSGEICYDTTDNQLVLDSIVIPTDNVEIWKVTVASTSPAFIGGALLPIPTQLDGYTMTAIRCKVDSGTNKVIAVEDASANSTEDITCLSSVTNDDGSITNATVTAAEEMYIDFGATSGAVDYVTISVFGDWTRE